MRLFLLLAGILIAAGLTIGAYAPDLAIVGAFATSEVLAAFALAGRSVVTREVA